MGAREPKFKVDRAGVGIGVELDNRTSADIRGVAQLSGAREGRGADEGERLVAGISAGSIGIDQRQIDSVSQLKVGDDIGGGNSIARFISRSEQERVVVCAT